MKPRAIFKRIDRSGCWFLLNWENRDGLSLAAPTLGSLIDRAQEEEAAKGMTLRETISATIEAACKKRQEADCAELFGPPPVISGSQSRWTQFVHQVSPGTDPGSSGTDPLTKEQHNA